MRDLGPMRDDLAAARDAQMRREADIIARGRADIGAGRGIELAELEAWFDQLDQDENAPLPGTQAHDG